MDLGVTGTRKGATAAQLDTAWWLFLTTFSGFSELHFGDCVGVDTQIFRMADQLGLFTVSHPPIIGTFRSFCHAGFTMPPKEYLERNRDIVSHSHSLIALPKESRDNPRGGTWYTIRYAVSRNCPVCIVWPDGSTEWRY